MSMNPPKQRRNRKKKETPLSPQAAREEAELRMKIQQSLQTQYVDRATVEDNVQGGGGNNNPLMMYGQMGMCGVVGGPQDMNMNPMMNHGMNAMQQEMMQREMMLQNQQGHFNGQQYDGMTLTPDEMAECMKNAEMKMYEMRLLQKKMMLQQKMNAMQQRQQQQQGWNPQMQQEAGINSVDIMRELRTKQEQLLQMGAVQKHMKEMNRGLSSGSDNHFYERGFSNNSQGFAERSEGNMHATNESPYFGDRPYGRQQSNQSAHSQRDDVVDLTGDLALDSCRQQMTSPMNQQMEAMVKQKMMEEIQRHQLPSPHMDTTMMMQGQQNFHSGQFSAQSPSPQNVQEVQARMQQMERNSSLNRQGDNMTNGISPGKSREMLSALMERITSEPESESGIESLLSMPTPGGGSVRDSLTVGDLQAWLAMKNSTGAETMGFHSVNGMSASFNSVMGDSMNLKDDNINTPGVESTEGFNTPFRKVTNDDDHNESPRRSVSNRDSSFDLEPIAEHGGQDGSRKDRISLSINDLKPGWKQDENARLRPPAKSRKGPSLAEAGKKDSLTVTDLKQIDLSKSTGCPSHSSGMSLSLGDFGEDILDPHTSASLMLQNSFVSHGIAPNSMRQSNQSDMNMSIDSMTYSALVKGNDSISELARDLSDLVEGDNESRASTSTDVCIGNDGRPGPLGVSQNSTASSSRSGRSQRKSNASRPSIMSEISQWSNSNPYGDNANDNEDANNVDDNERQKSGDTGKSLDVDDLEALHDSVDFSLSMMSSMHMSEMIDTDLMSSMQGLEVSPTSRQGSDENNGFK